MWFAIARIWQCTIHQWVFRVDMWLWFSKVHRPNKRTQ